MELSRAEKRVFEVAYVFQHLGSLDFGKGDHPKPKPTSRRQIINDAMSIRGVVEKEVEEAGVKPATADTFRCSGMSEDEWEAVVDGLVEKGILKEAGSDSTGDRTYFIPPEYLHLAGGYEFPFDQNDGHRPD